MVFLDAYLSEDSLVGLSVAGFWCLFVLEMVTYLGMTVISRAGDPPDSTGGKKESDELEAELKTILGIQGGALAEGDTLSTVVGVLGSLSKAVQVLAMLHRFAGYTALYIVTGVAASAILRPFGWS